MAPTGRSRRTKTNGKVSSTTNATVSSSPTVPSPGMIGRPGRGGRGGGNRSKGRPAKHSRGGRGASLPKTITAKALSNSNSSSSSPSKATTNSIPASLPAIPVQPPLPPPQIPPPPTVPLPSPPTGFGNIRQRTRSSPVTEFQSPLSPSKVQIPKIPIRDSNLNRTNNNINLNGNKSNDIEDSIDPSTDIVNTFSEVLDSINLKYNEQSNSLIGNNIDKLPTESQLSQLRLLLLRLRRKIVVEMLRQGASISSIRSCVETDNDSTHDVSKNNIDVPIDNNNDNKSTQNQAIARRESTIIKIGGDGEKIHIKLEKRPINTDNNENNRKHSLNSNNENETNNYEKKEDDNEDNDYHIDLTSAIQSNNDNNSDNDGDDEDNLRPRKKMRIKLEDEDDEKSIKLVINKNKSKSIDLDNANNNVTNEKDNNLDYVNDSDIFIPSVYKSKDLDSNQILNMEELRTKSVKELNLYDDEQNKEISKDETEYKKRKYAVSEFPKSDLKDMLPGEIPMIDFSGPKPTQQVAWNSFTAYIEPFYRNFTEDDIKFLKQKFVASNFLTKFIIANDGYINDNTDESGNNNSSNLTGSNNKSNDNKNNENNYNPYVIPPLGPKYSDIWALEDEGKPVKMGRLTQSLSSKMKKMYAPKGNPNNFDVNKPDALVSLCEEPDKISCGPLTSRILSAIVSDDEDDIFELDDGENTETDNDNNDKNENNEDDNSNHNKKEDKISFEQLEKRLNRELKYIGVFMNVVQTLNNSSWEQDWTLGKEDDEVSNELRNLQKELTEIQKKNNFRKEILIPIIEEQIAWQEYMMIVDDLDKQVEQHYRRRLNVAPKKTKKRGNHATDNNNGSNGSVLMKDDAAHLVSNASFRGLLDKRKRWIEKIGSLFKSPLEMRRMPKETIFKVEEDEVDEEEVEEQDEGEEDEEEEDEEGEEEDEGEEDENNEKEGNEEKEEKTNSNINESKKSNDTPTGKNNNEEEEEDNEEDNEDDEDEEDEEDDDNDDDNEEEEEEEEDDDDDNEEEEEDDDDDNDDDDDDDDDDNEEDEDNEDDGEEEDNDMEVIEEEPEEEDDEDDDDEDDEDDN